MTSVVDDMICESEQLVQSEGTFWRARHMFDESSNLQIAEVRLKRWPSLNANALRASYKSDFVELFEVQIQENGAERVDSNVARGYDMHCISTRGTIVGASFYSCNRVGNVF